MGVPDDEGHDLAEAEGDDGEVVAAEAEGRGPEQHAEDPGDDRRDDHRQPEVHGGGIGEGEGALARGHECHRVRADGEEGGIAEVEQPGEADHDVQPEGQDDEEEHRDQLRLQAEPEHALDEGVCDREREGAEEDRRALLVGVAHVRETWDRQPAEDLHRSGVSSPRRPVGRNTRMTTSSVNTPTFSHSPP